MEIRLEDPRVARLHAAGLPFVGIGHTAGDQQMSWIDVDYAGLIQHCVRHLADLGHRRVALITRSPELIAAGYGPARRAREGFEKALAERGLDGIEVPCGDDARSGQECMTALLQSHPDLTAVTTINEAALPGIQRALSDTGLEVPYDFSITGVAARTWAEDFRPPLTAADVPAAEMAAQALSLLTERISDPSTPPQHILMTPSITLRHSTAAAGIGSVRSPL
jgi:DNA-binding LacI/PurR family transcriptional regulator